MYDIFIYPYLPKSPTATGDAGYIIEYDPRAADETISSTSSSTSHSSAKYSTPSLLSLLKRYILRSKVRVRDVTSEWDLWAVWNSRPGSYLSGGHGEQPVPRELDQKPDTWRWGRSGAVEPVFLPTETLKSSEEEERHARAWVLGEHDETIEASGDRKPLWLVDRRAPGMGARVLLPKGLKPARDEDVLPSSRYTLHRILLGVPEGVEDMPAQETFPMDANMDMMGGIDFRKGCYVGQELTVRTYHTGVIRKRVFPVQVLPSTGAGETSLPILTPQTPIHAAWTIQSTPETPRPRPRGPGKLLSSTPEGYALALLRLEVFQAAEQGEMDLSIQNTNKGDEESGEASTLKVVAKRPEWWPAQLGDT
ncbi:ccr4 associated factor [Tulasnella sp. 403]|nr:ccr4 associated factor [Tulasnella sp. 403]